jgi:hypothetical protein
MDHTLDATTAEAIALLKDFELLESLGCSRMVTESDCLELIEACNGVNEVQSPYSAIMPEYFNIA